MSPTGNVFYDFILAVVGLATAIGLLVLGPKGWQRVGRDTEKVKENPLPPSWREMWDEMRKLRGEFDALRTDHLDLKSRMGVVEQDRDALGDGLRVIAEWDDAGRPDPPGFPGIAAHARHVLDRLHNH